MVGSLSAVFYIAVFLPHFFLGWWAGIADLLHYYSDVMWYEGSVKAATHPYSSQWWTWPLMLRPIAYWQNFPPQGKVATIWGGGNPLLWWSALTAITITAVRALERPNPARTFLVFGYLSYLAMWMPVGRTLFLYHYMPSVYLGYLALAAIVADAWRGEAEMWECAALLVTMIPACMLGLGFWAGLFPSTALALLAMYMIAAETCSRGRSRFGGSAMGAAADRRPVCDRGGDPVRLLLSDLDWNFDRSRGLLQPDVAAGAGAAQLDMSTAWFPSAEGEGSGERSVCA